MFEPSVFTVIGCYLDDQPVVLGVIRGSHAVTGGDQALGPWAEEVTAVTATEAASVALFEREVEARVAMFQI